MATVTNHHKLGGLKQHTFIFLQSWGSVVQNQIQRPQIKVSAGLFPFGGTEKRIQFLVFSSFLPCIPCLAAPVSIFKASSRASCFKCHLCQITLCFSFLDPCDSMQAPPGCSRIIFPSQDRNQITSAECLFPSTSTGSGE